MAERRKRGKRSTTAQEAIVLIPLTYNDATEVPREVLEAIFDELYLAFHGWTIEGTVKGAYRMLTGQKRVEDLLKVSVILDKTQVPDLEAMVSRWGAQLGQEAMLLKIADWVIKFIPPQSGAGQS